jgi:RNA polymerase sigma-70 factor (ECF subfamily)
LTLLDAIEDGATAGYQPWWVAKGYLLARAGEVAKARECYVRAVGLTVLPEVRAYLVGKVEGLAGG